MLYTEHNSSPIQTDPRSIKKSSMFVPNHKTQKRILNTEAREATLRKTYKTYKLVQQGAKT